MGGIYRDESGSFVQFGPFEEQNFYDIEHSADCGNNKLKTVEFVCLQHKNKLVFVEAKKTCPKLPSNAEDRIRKLLKADSLAVFEELLSHHVIKSSYVADVCEKFITSMCMTLAIANGYAISEDMPHSMQVSVKQRNVQIVFLLVITDCKPDWAENIKRIFEKELRAFRHTNNAQVVVLTAKQAEKRHIVNKIYAH